MNLIDNIKYNGGFRFKNSDYEFRLVAFVDLLGFKNALQRLGCKEILESLRVFRRETDKKTYHERLFDSTFHKSQFDDKYKKEIQDHSIKAKREQDRRVTVFSDLVVISYRGSKKYLEWCFKELVDTLAFSENFLIGRGLLLRGAITYDKFFHDEEYCVGDALVRTYELESQKANTPRIIIDPRLNKYSIFKEWCENNIHLNYNEEDKLWETDIHVRIAQLCSGLSKENSENLIEFKENIYYDMICLSEIIQEGLKSGHKKTMSKAELMLKKYNLTFNILEKSIGVSKEGLECEDIKLNFHKLKPLGNE